MSERPLSPVDDQIAEYLRARGRVEAPVGLVDEVMRVVEAAPRRGASWFSAFLPAVAAVAVVAIVVVLASIVANPAPAGPPPSAQQTASPLLSPTPTPPDRSAAPSPMPSPTRAGSQSLLAAGDTATLQAVHDGEPYGMITLERGEDVGGYPLVPEPSSQTHFFVEVFVTYQLDAPAEGAEWGMFDWQVRSLDAVVAAEPLTVFPPPLDRPYVGQWPGATVPEREYDGWLIFPIPREWAPAELDLWYVPSDTSAGAIIPLRAPADPPAPVVSAWPRPDPVYVEKPGLPFTVLESADADALFEEADTCTNPGAGYTVSYPDSWWTNTAIGDTPACSWFSPTFFEADPDGPPPEEIAIGIDVFEGAVGFIWVPLYEEQVMLDGIEARRYEDGETKDVETPTDRFHYYYLAALDEVIDGRKLWASTHHDSGGDYELNKAVLDRIMASLEWLD